MLHAVESYCYRYPLLFASRNLLWGCLIGKALKTTTKKEGSLKTAPTLYAHIPTWVISFISPSFSLTSNPYSQKRRGGEQKEKMSRNTSSCTNNNVSIVGSVSGPCGACKFLRRKCVRDCIFAPYFDSESGSHFAAVHKVFGASNVSKLLLRIPAHKRLDAVVTICYEAQARIRDPVYGCVSHIFSLQQQVCGLNANASALNNLVFT